MDPLTIAIAAFILTCAIIGLIKVISFTFKAILIPIWKKMRSKPGVTRTPVIARTIFNDMIDVMQEKGMQKSANKLKNMLTNKNSKVALMMDEKGNMLEIEEVVAENPELDEFSEDIAEIMTIKGTPAIRTF